jgi:hypothetical protein
MEDGADDATVCCGDRRNAPGCGGSSEWRHTVDKQSWESSMSDWMLFVDGENFTLRGQELAMATGTEA